MKQTSLLFLLILSLSVQAQRFIPGQTYFSPDSFIEYIAGDLPIILSAPHGGYISPAHIPDRNCAGCVYLRDSYTQEMARETLDSLHTATGCYPHVIINRLHRKKMDANRDLPEAASGDSLAGAAWFAFQAFIDSAKVAVTQRYGKGLFLDLHGHAHSIQRLELGYLLTRSNLQNSDSVLNTESYVSRSSIRNLVTNNLQTHSHAQLLRHAFGFGTLLAHVNFPAVPSLQDPFPIGSEPFFSGGYNTRRHGSRDSGSIDAIQIECNRDLRFDDSTRQSFAGRLSDQVIIYLETYYFENFSASFCRNNTSSDEVILSDDLIQIFPNPAADQLFIEFEETGTYQIMLFDLSGKVILSQQKRPNQHKVELDLEKILQATYYVVLIDQKGKRTIKKLVIH